MSSSDDIFDVAVDRQRRFERQQQTWSTKRKKIDSELMTALSDALGEQDACESNSKLVAVSQLIKRRKIATSLCSALSLQAAAEARFGTKGLKNIIYADPPWEYKRTTHKCGTGTQYKTMSEADLAALPVAGLAAEDAVLVMWTTFHMLEASVNLFPAWGFEAKTVFCVWVKVDRAGNPLHGRGSYTRPCAEYALLGVRGSLQIQQKHSTLSSILRARPPGGHSRKPPIVRDMIVQMFGDLPRIELFARTQPPDWEVWGDQVTHFTNDWTNDDSDDVNQSFLPCTIDRKKQRSDRFYKIDLKGAAETFASTTVGTSFGRFRYEFDADAPGILSAIDDEHDHDGTRDCCRPLSQLISNRELRNVTRIDAYLKNQRSYDAVRNTLYTSNSEATIRNHTTQIRQHQQFNSDLLHAINHNDRCARVRVSAPIAMPTLDTSDDKNKHEKNNL